MTKLEKMALKAHSACEHTAAYTVCVPCCSAFAEQIVRGAAQAADLFSHKASAEIYAHFGLKAEEDPRG